MIKLIVVGKMKNKALAQLCADYSARLAKYDKLEIVELKDSTLPKEAERMLEIISSSKGKIYVLSEEGKMFTSVEFSKKLENDMLSGGSVFVIGSAYGLAESVKKSADILMAISPLTFTHEWARAIFLEQLYRAKTISAGTGYHH